MIFRIEYEREGKIRHMTIGKRNIALAALFAYTTLADYIRSIDPKSEIKSIIPVTRERDVCYHRSR